MDVLKQKARASTLIEALVAIIIIMAAFTSGTMIYVNVINSDNGFQKLKASSMIKKVVNDTKINSTYLNSKITEDNITISKSVDNYPRATSAFILSVSAFDAKSHLLADYHEVLLK